MNIKPDLHLVPLLNDEVDITLDLLSVMLSPMDVQYKKERSYEILDYTKTEIKEHLDLITKLMLHSMQWNKFK